MALAWMGRTFLSCPWTALNAATDAWVFCIFLCCLQTALMSPPLSTVPHIAINPLPSTAVANGLGR